MESMNNFEGGYMEKEAIKVWIKQYIENTIHITINEKMSLFNPGNGLLPRDLLQLYYAMEKHFGIKFEERNILDERFDYLDNMAAAVYEKIEKQ